MPSYNVIIQPEAEKDLDEAYEYLEAQQLTLGFDLLEELVYVLEILEENPFLFQKIDSEKRRAIVRRFGYNVIYTVKGNDVFILAILHERRNPKKWKDRK